MRSVAALLFISSITIGITNPALIVDPNFGLATENGADDTVLLGSARVTNTLVVSGNVSMTGSGGVSITAGNLTVSKDISSQNLYVQGGKVNIGSVAGQTSLLQVGGPVSITNSFGFQVENNTFFVNASTDNVGIGNVIPEEKLEVTGQVLAGDFITKDQIVAYNDSNTNIDMVAAGDQIIMTAGGARMFEMVNTTQDEVTVNQTGNDVDFRVETSGEDNSLFVQGSDGNVGIGTTTPSSSLQVSGSTSMTVNLDVANRISSTLEISKNISSTGNITASNDISSARLYVLGGNVGIGTGIPAAKLEVTGTISGTAARVTGNVGIGASPVITSTPLHVYGTAAAPASSGTTSNAIMRMRDNNNVVMEFGNYGSPSWIGYIRNAEGQGSLGTAYPMVLNPLGGNIGIGTGSSAPSNSLQISGTSATMEINNTGASSWSTMELKASAQEWHVGVGGASVANVANDWYVYNENDVAFRMVIDDTGNVGIGNTSPTALLTVSGNTSTTGNLSTSGKISGLSLGVASNTFISSLPTAPSYSGIWVGQSAPSISNYALASNGTTLVVNSPSGQGTGFTVGNGNYNMFVTSGGNVGIGTNNTSPNALLGVTGLISATNITASKAITSETLSLGDGTASVPSLHFTSDINTGISHVSSEQMEFTANGEPMMYMNGVLFPYTEINPSKNVLNRLFVYGSMVDPMLYVGGTTVGVGTSVPTHSLTVSGTVSTSGIIYSSGGISTTGIVTAGNYILSNNQFFAGGSVGAPGYSFTSDTDTGMYLSGADTLMLGTAGTERMRIGSTGNIGIGVSVNASATLYVTGSMTVSPTAGHTSSPPYFKSTTIYLRSPDGTCSSCGPNNSDVWSCVSVACPAN